jgi:hypothetical protein
VSKRQQQRDGIMKLHPKVRFLIPALIFTTVAFSAVMIGSFAQAEIIFTSPNLDIVASAPINVGTTPLKAVTLTAIGYNNYKPKTFDSTKSDFGGGGNGITTPAGNLLHQVGWKIDEAPFYTDLYTPTNSPNLALTLDTHFLIDSNTYSSSYGPSETMNVANTADSIYGHYGDSLVGTFSLNSLPTSPTWNFAYIVVPNNAVVHLNFEIIARTVNGDQSLANVGYFLAVPEPNVLILLGTFGIGLLFHALRRRKS